VADVMSQSKDEHEYVRHLHMCNEDLPAKDKDKERKKNSKDKDKDDAQFIVCVDEHMAQLAARSTVLLIDTTYKLVLKGWRVFVVATWDNLAQRAVVLARVFTNSLSEAAHKLYAFAHSASHCWLRMWGAVIDAWRHFGVEINWRQYDSSNPRCLTASLQCTRSICTTGRFS
jgi:hypothetical protein